MTVEKKLLDNGKVEVIETTEQDRYEGFIEYDGCECDFVRDDFKEQNKVWCRGGREGFEALNTGENWEPDTGSVEGDIESFQKYLDETYGKDKYEAYAFGAYVHSGVAFGFCKHKYVNQFDSGGWDSSTIGFVGINKELNVDLNEYASNLSDAWNGNIEVLSVYDNYNEEQVDSIWSTESQEAINKWKDEMKEKYGVTEYKQQ